MSNPRISCLGIIKFIQQDFRTTPEQCRAAAHSPLENLVFEIILCSFWGLLAGWCFRSAQVIQKEKN